MKLTFANIGWFVCLAALAVLSISAINHKKDGTLTDVKVHIEEFEGGEFFLTEQDVYEEVLDIIITPEDMLIRDVEAAGIETLLHSNPFIRAVNVFVSSDGVLNVTVSQREPILRVFDAAGDTYYVDREGLAMPVSKLFTARVPVATGYIEFTELVLDGETVESDWRRLYSLILAIDKDPFYRSMTAQLDVSKNQEITLIPTIGETKILFGHADRIDEKLENLSAFYKKVLENEGWDAYESINLAIRGQIVCKRKPNHNK